MFPETDGDMGEDVDEDNMDEDESGDVGNELEQHVSLTAEDAEDEMNGVGEDDDEVDDVLMMFYQTQKRLPLHE